MKNKLLNKNNFEDFLWIVKENLGSLKGVKIHCNTITERILITHNSPEVILDINDWFIDHYSLLRKIPDYGHNDTGEDLGEFGLSKKAWLMINGGNNG